MWEAGYGWRLEICNGNHKLWCLVENFEVVGPHFPVTSNIKLQQEISTRDSYNFPKPQFSCRRHKVLAFNFEKLYNAIIYEGIVADLREALAAFSILILRLMSTGSTSDSAWFKYYSIPDAPSISSIPQVIQGHHDSQTAFASRQLNREALHDATDCRDALAQSLN
ncbi:hypothetical protein Nepgr_002453 [Nepenthes gracilis]|uniref:Uncharacterized protein n=1 Tax=Nepenthes gracilis TaxID=150966 RepID=A0AAD3P6A1_NEPGR|nr:hypothetical protein Nepgr_002453 [Nepenthes gracilis]